MAQFVFTGSEIVVPFETTPVSGIVVTGTTKLLSAKRRSEYYAAGGESDKVTKEQSSFAAEARLVVEHVRSWDVVDGDGNAVDVCLPVLFLLPPAIYDQIATLVFGGFADALKKKSEPSSN